MKKDLTTGNVFQTILYFALPYLLSYFLQTLYGMADLYIIGQFNGVAATTAVSIGSQVMHMLTVIIVGLAMGTTVTVGRAIGAKKTDEASLAIGNTVTLFMIVSVVFTLGLLLLLKPIVALISTPQEAVQGTIQYLFVCFIGIPFITAYNIISSIFRGLGDSKSPMYFVAVACVANIGLDYLFVGAALGTTLAQTISVAISLIAIHKKQIGVHLTKKDFKPQVSVMKMLLSIGVPVALQDGFIQVAFIVITIIANQRGLNPAAAVGIVEKFISAAFIVPSSMLATVSALAAQNIGADKHDRAAKTLYAAMLITSVYGILIGLVTEVAAEYILGFFTKDAVVIVLGSQYLRAYIWDAFLAGFHFCFTGYFCAYGLSYIGFIHNVLAIVLVRIPGAYFTSKWFPDTLFPMGMSAPVGSLLSALICIVFFIWLKKRKVIYGRNETVYIRISGIYGACQYGNSAAL